MDATVEATRKSMAAQVASLEKIFATVDVKTDGDSATVTPAAGKPIQLKKIDGKWLVLPETAGIPATTSPQNKLQLVFAQKMPAVDQQFLADVKAKKFATCKDAIAALQNTMRVAMGQAYAEFQAAEKSASQPAATTPQ
jgi:hypothetical protein